MRLAKIALLTTLSAIIAPPLATAAPPIAATAASPSARQRPIENPITIDPTRPAQQILGFGASGCWWAQEIGAWPEPERRELLRLLYDQKTGIALTIYRHNLGAGTHADTTIRNPMRRSESMLDTATGRYDWTRDANARRILREAVESGATEVILFANSAPVSMTKNGRGYGDKQPENQKASNLSPDRHADFAACLAEITDHFLRVEKLPVTVLSPVNEPDWAWADPKQEGSHNTPAETASILKATLAEIQRRRLPVRVEGPEGGSWHSTLPYFEAINNDPALRASLDEFAVHSYWRKPGDKEKLRAWLDKHRPDALLHMTEWCDMQRGLAPGMDGALPLAATLIDDFTIGRVNTWQWWLAASSYNYRDGLIHYDPQTRVITPTKRYWVLGQFSRYLPKNSVVLPIKTKTPAPDPQLRAMAARLPDGRVALICANLSDTEKPLQIQFPKNETWRQQLRTLTDENNNNNTTPASNLLPPQSVVTLIFEKHP